VAELEKRVAEKEQAIRDLEHIMASPGFYDDRSESEKGVAQYESLKADVAALMREWETLQTAAEAKG